MCSNVVKTLVDFCGVKYLNFKNFKTFEKFSGKSYSEFLVHNSKEFSKFFVIKSTVQIKFVCNIFSGVFFYAKFLWSEGRYRR